MNTTIITNLEQILGSTSKPSGEERLFNCPFCGHHKKKLSINFGKRAGMWKCWICNRRGKRLYYLLRAVGVSHSEIKKILEDFETVRDFIPPKEDSIPIILPPEYTPMWKGSQNSYEFKNAIAFLKRRGVTRDDIYRYRIGYCESGEYSNRIIVPSYDVNGHINFFVSRKYFKGDYAYQNPEFSKNIIGFENLINWDMPVVLVEGVFDAIAIRRNAIPLLGKVPSDYLKMRLILEQPPMIYIVLDADAHTSAMKIETFLKYEGLSCKNVLLTNGDPSDIGFDQIWDYIGNAQQTTFIDLIKSKL